MRSPYSGSKDDRVRGECSGLPECCINFFIETWRMDPQANPEHDAKMIENRENGFEFHYIPCPTCLENKRFVEIKSCDGPHCFCGQWAHRQLVDSATLEIAPIVNKYYKKWKRSVRMNRKKRRGY